MKFYRFFLCYFFKPGTDRGAVFLVPVHGGIWTLCTNLNETELLILQNEIGFPKKITKCVSYLDGNVDNSRTVGVDEPRADWQHSESQTTLNPNLSRYNENVFDKQFLQMSSNNRKLTITEDILT